jgi:hypothetical protein
VAEPVITVPRQLLTVRIAVDGVTRLVTGTLEGGEPPPPEPPPPPVLSFHGFPAQVEEGEPVSLSWTSEGASQVRLDGAPVEPQQPLGRNFVPPLVPGGTYAYKLVAVNAGGMTEKVFEVKVTARPGPAPATALKFDFGTPDSPVLEGWRKVVAEDAYTPERGWGFLTPGLTSADNARDRGAWDSSNYWRVPNDAMTRDWVGANDWRFRIDLPNGEHTVRVVAGDSKGPLAGIHVEINGAEVGVFDTRQCWPVNLYYKADVTDGKLVVRLHGEGGACVCGVEIDGGYVAPNPVKARHKFMFGPPTVQPLPGYALVTRLDGYTPQVGWGWWVTVVPDDYDQSSVFDDHHRGAAAHAVLQFRVAVPPGSYKVRTSHSGGPAHEFHARVNGGPQRLVSHPPFGKAEVDWEVAAPDGMITVEAERFPKVAGNIALISALTVEPAGGPAPPPVTKPTVDLSVDDAEIDKGQSAVLSWTSKDADAVRLDGLAVPASGTKTVTPAATTTYMLTASGPGGDAEPALVTVTVTDPGPGPGPAEDVVVYDVQSDEAWDLFVGPGASSDHGMHVEHPEHVARFWKLPTIRRVKAGRWGDPTIWDEGRVPREGDVVDAGRVRFDVTVDTRMRVRNLLVNKNADGIGILEIGTDAAPVTDRTCEVSFADGAFEPSDAEEWGLGLVSTGVVKVKVANPRTKRGRALGEVPAGAASVTFRWPVQNWRAGDELVIPDTRKLTSFMANGTGLPNEPGFVNALEQRKVASISADGRTVTFDRPLTYPHPGAWRWVTRETYDAVVASGLYPPGVPTRPALDGEGLFVLHASAPVANVTRQVTFRSEAPGRHHVAFCHEAETDLDGARFDNFGRTTAEPTGPGNRKGRYRGPHFHHATGRKRMVNCSVTGPLDAPQKWPVVLHACRDAEVRDNVVVGGTGWGIGCEDGSEYGNLIQGNVVMGIRAHGQQYLDAFRSDGGTGEGLWFRGPANHVWDNEVYDCIGGMVVWQRGLQGPLPGPDGPWRPHQVGIDFRGNECGGGRMSTALVLWEIGLGPSQPALEPDAGPSLVDGLLAWSLYDQGYFSYMTDRVTYRGLLFIDTTDGIVGDDYRMENSLVEDSELHGLRYAWLPSTVGASQRMKNCLIADCEVGVAAGLRWGVPGGQLGAPRHIGLEAVRFVRTQTYISLGRQDEGTGPLLDVTNLRAADVITVKDHQGAAGDGFRVWFPAQKADHVLRASEPIDAGPPDRLYYSVCGSQEPGLTNAQLKAKYGYCRAGEVAPAETTTRPGVTGLIGPYAAPAPG